ncbi:MAG: glycosyltransferase family 4 protein [Cytophagaceae bacterium]|nr:glycosyltransferase family 4 protein [Cytophagaceae bacterium]
MKIHLVSSTEFMTQGTGVHSAFMGMQNLLKEKNDIEVITNGQGKGDIFHSHSYGLYYFLKSASYKGRRIHTVHTTPDTVKGSVIFSGMILPFANLYFKMVFNHADVCIAISPMVESRLRKLKVKSRIFRLDNPIDFSKWRPESDYREKGRNMLGILPHKKVILGVGQLQKRKGVEDFLEIAEKNPEFEFVWVGGRPFGLVTEGVARINQKIENAPGNVHFAGMISQENMPLVYAAADVLLFPSYQENSPLVPLEAASAGLPVIFRDLKEYELLYENEYLKARTNEEFSLILKMLCSDAEFYKIGTSISSKLIKQFDKDFIREKLLKLYTEVYSGVYARKSRSSFAKRIKLKAAFSSGTFANQI